MSKTVRKPPKMNARIGKKRYLMTDRWKDGSFGNLFKTQKLQTSNKHGAASSLLFGHPPNTTRFMSKGGNSNAGGLFTVKYICGEGLECCATLYLIWEQESKKKKTYFPGYDKSKFNCNSEEWDGFCVKCKNSLRVLTPKRSLLDDDEIDFNFDEDDTDSSNASAPNNEFYDLEEVEEMEEFDERVDPSRRRRRRGRRHLEIDGRDSGGFLEEEDGLNMSERTFDHDGDDDDDMALRSDSLDSFKWPEENTPGALSVSLPDGLEVDSSNPLETLCESISTFREDDEDEDDMDNEIDLDQPTQIPWYQQYGQFAQLFPERSFRRSIGRRLYEEYISSLQTVQQNQQRSSRALANPNQVQNVEPSKTPQKPVEELKSTPPRKQEFGLQKPKPVDSIPPPPGLLSIPMLPPTPSELTEPVPRTPPSGSGSSGKSHMSRLQQLLMRRPINNSDEQPSPTPNPEPEREVPLITKISFDKGEDVWTQMVNRRKNYVLLDVERAKVSEHLKFLGEREDEYRNKLFLMRMMEYLGIGESLCEKGESKGESEGESCKSKSKSGTYQEMWNDAQYYLREKKELEHILKTVREDRARKTEQRLRMQKKQRKQVLEMDRRIEKERRRWNLLVAQVKKLKEKQKGKEASSKFSERETKKLKKISKTSTED